MKNKHASGFSGASIHILLLLLLTILVVNTKAVWAEDSGHNLQPKTSVSEEKSGQVLKKEISKEVGSTYEKTLSDGPGGHVNMGVKTGASGEGTTTFGPDGAGVTAEGRAGIKAELEAISEEYTAGNEYVQGSAQFQGKVEALLGAEGAVNAYIDKTGISISAEARAGAYVSARAEATFGASVFGVQANVTVYGEAHAGIVAEGKANVTIGFDGKVKFELGAGVSFGVGASVGMAFDIDAWALIEQLDGVDNFEQLFEWIENFVADPRQTIDDLIEQGVDYLKDKTYDYVQDFVQKQLEDINKIPRLIEVPFLIGEGIEYGDRFFRYGNWYGPGWSGGSEGTTGDKPPVDELDAICMRHDFAYLIAEQQGEIYGPREEARLKAIADAVAAREASKLDPDPSKWHPPAADPDKARRYRDRMERLFGDYTSPVRDSYGRILNISDWILSPIENYYLNYSSNRLTPSQLTLYVNTLVNNWYRNHPEAGENPYKDDVNLYKGEVNPYKGEMNPYKGEMNPYKGEVNPYKGEVNPYKN